ncbi:MAG: 6,7-dimethyl-8-ribityllumazine synthase [Myxococcota bacterium]
MPNVIEGTLVDPGGRFAIVAGRFNDFIVGRLVDGAMDAFARHGIDTDDRVDLVWAPGAYELPLVTKMLANSGKYSAVVVLGAVIRGSTPHFDYVASEVSKGVANVSIDAEVPCIFGVLTTDTIEQAVERAGTKAGNHGFKAAVSAIEMTSLFAAMRSA